MKPALTLEPGEGIDYVFALPKGRSVWIKVENVAVQIYRGPDAVQTMLYADGAEAQHDALDSACVYYTDAKEFQ